MGEERLSVIVSYTREGASLRLYIHVYIFHSTKSGVIERLAVYGCTIYGCKDQDQGEPPLLRFSKRILAITAQTRSIALPNLHIRYLSSVPYPF